MPLPYVPPPAEELKAAETLRKPIVKRVQSKRADEAQPLDDVGPGSPTPQTTRPAPPNPPETLPPASPPPGTPDDTSPSISQASDQTDHIAGNDDRRGP